MLISTVLNISKVLKEKVSDGTKILSVKPVLIDMSFPSPFPHIIHFYIKPQFLLKILRVPGKCFHLDNDIIPATYNPVFL